MVKRHMLKEISRNAPPKGYQKDDLQGVYHKILYNIVFYGIYLETHLIDNPTIFSINFQIFSSKII